MVEDFEMIFVVFDEGILVNISEEKTAKNARKILQIFFLYIADRFIENNRGLSSGSFIIYSDRPENVNFG